MSASAAVTSRTRATQHHPWRLLFANGTPIIRGNYDRFTFYGHTPLSSHIVIVFCCCQLYLIKWIFFCGTLRRRSKVRCVKLVYRFLFLLIAYSWAFFWKNYYEQVQKMCLLVYFNFPSSQKFHLSKGGRSGLFILLYVQQSLSAKTVN